MVYYRSVGSIPPKRHTQHRTPTRGVIGQFGWIGARPEQTSSVSDGDGAPTAVAVAAALGRILMRKLLRIGVPREKRYALRATPAHASPAPAVTPRRASRSLRVATPGGISSRPSKNRLTSARLRGRNRSAPDSL